MTARQSTNPNLRQTGSRRSAYAYQWPTLLLLLGVAAGFGLLLALPGTWAMVSVPAMALILTLHSSLTHEILHGNPLRTPWARDALGLFQPGLFVPYLRFKALHLAHHNDALLTDPYDDPETNYKDPAVWHRMSGWQQRLCLINNTLLGRMAVGPLLGTWSFVKNDARAIWQGDRVVLGHWAAHLPGLALTLWLVSRSEMPVWAYVLACYLALSILKIRTFLEHQAHERASGRSVIVEDRGILAFLFLNNNLHVVHHMHPDVPWFDLPQLYARQKAHYQRRNHGYVYASYRQIFRRFGTCRKDPVAHPLWQKHTDEIVKGHEPFHL